MVLENKFISYFIFCAASSLAEHEARQSDSDASNALFSQTGYPQVGDIPVLNRKVFRGMRVSIMEHPYVVSIRRLRAHYLVGSLLMPNVAVTVAHPIYNVSTLELSVVAGENYCDRGSSLLTVTVVTHERFDPYTLRADLAMIRFFDDIILKVSQKTIPLFGPTSELGKINWEYKAYVTGWGRCDWSGRELCWPRSSIYYPDEKIDPMLRTVTFKFVDPERNVFCKAYENHNVPLRPGMLCAGPARFVEPLAPCLAVPGAPLVVIGQLVGLQSWGLGCGFTQDLPLVYTDVDYYSDWLVNNLLVMNHAKHETMFEMYQLTRATLVREWLLRTRDSGQVRAFANDGPVTVTGLDRELAGLRGHVTDFRDYIDDGKHTAAKQEMFQKLQHHAELLKRIKEIHDNITTPASHPFFASKQLDEDADYVMQDSSPADMAAHFLTNSEFISSSVPSPASVDGDELNQ